jgi:sugar phosphate isomerase/epimerase
MVLACSYCSIVRADDAASRPAAHVDHKGLLKLGWQLACQSQTFHGRSVAEMLPLLHGMDFHHIELAPGQILWAEQPNITVGPEMAQSDIDALRAKLKTAHLDIVSYGVTDPGNDPAAARRVFELASELKAKNIVASPSPDALEMLDGLAGEYRINLAIINSAKPGPFWDGDSMLAALRGRSNRIGVCADVANWRRSGLEPVQCLTKLAGHVIEAHLSDVNDHGQEVPLGAGTVGIDNVLGWFKQENFQGIFAIQCGIGGGEEREADLVDSVNAFSDQVTRLAAEGTGAR